MTSRFRLSSAGDRDISDIWEYIASANLVAANKVLERPCATILWLSRYPQAGRRRPDVTNREIFFWPDGNYKFSIGTFPSFIEVVAVLHGKRDIPSALRESQDEAAHQDEQQD